MSASTIAAAQDPAPPHAPPAPNPTPDRAALLAERGRLLAALRRGEGTPEIAARIHQLSLRLGGA